MEDNFISVIAYLENLQKDLINQELTNEEKLLIIIKYALLNDNYHSGSVIFTKNKDNYVVSSIQKHSYAWILQGKLIDVNYILNKLTELDINYLLEYYPISDHINDYELSFDIPKLKKRIRVTK